MGLAAGLCPDLLWEIQRSPRPVSCNWERDPTSKGREKMGGKGVGIKYLIYSYGPVQPAVKCKHRVNVSFLTHHNQRGNSVLKRKEMETGKKEQKKEEMVRETGGDEQREE